MESGHLLLHFHVYLLSHVFAAKWKILRGGSHRDKSNQPKTRKNICLYFLPQPGIEPRTGQSSVLNLLPYHLSHHTSVFYFFIIILFFYFLHYFASNNLATPIPKSVVNSNYTVIHSLLSLSPSIYLS